MQEERNKWIEDVLGSADSVNRASAPDMADRILSRTRGRQVSMIAVSSSAVLRIAASVILLVALNAGTIYLYGSYRHSEQMSSSQDSASIFGLETGTGAQTDLGTVIFGN